MQRLIFLPSNVTQHYWLARRFRLHLRQTDYLQLRNATAGATQRMAGGGERQRENMWVRGNADICQEIDNSNKLVAKHSNRLPNGTSVHSNPRLRTKHRIFPPPLPLPPPLAPMQRLVHGSAGVMGEHASDYLLAGTLRTGELITVRRFAGRFYFSS